MTKKHPFADLIGLVFEDRAQDYSYCKLAVNEDLYNPYYTVHGGVLYSMADTGMGAALAHLLESDEVCATIEIKISYFKPVRIGTLECKSMVINKGKTVASLESDILNDGKLVAKAHGTFSIFRPDEASKNRS
jgi:acyl-CoA thioesterase